jgi:hypothetical protein
MSDAGTPRTPSGLGPGIRAIPLWARIAVPAVVVMLAVPVIALAGRGGDEAPRVASAPERTATTTEVTTTTTTTATTVPPTTAAPMLPVPPATEAPATEPPAIDPPAIDPPVAASPVPVSLRIALSSPTMASGSTMAASVIVDNPGPDRHVGGCYAIFQIVLGNDAIPAEPGPWPLCLRDITIPAGTSTWPLTVSAHYLTCTGDVPATSGSPSCLPDLTPPPFPPGEYQAVLFALVDIGPAPAPVPVTVTSSAAER